MGTLEWTVERMDELTNVNRLVAAAAPRFVAPEVWDEADFAALFEQHYGRLVGVVARLVGERAQAEEIAGDAFWKLYHLPRLQAAGNNIPGWLYRAATRMGIDALRARQRGWRDQQRLGFEAAAGRAERQGEGSPLGALVRREQAEQVRVALRRLKPAQAEILILRHSGWSYLELAVTLELRPSSVGTTLARAEAAFEKAYLRGEA